MGSKQVYEAFTKSAVNEGLVTGEENSGQQLDGREYTRSVLLTFIFGKKHTLIP